MQDYISSITVLECPDMVVKCNEYNLGIPEVLVKKYERKTER